MYQVLFHPHKTAKLVCATNVVTRTNHLVNTITPPSRFLCKDNKIDFLFTFFFVIPKTNSSFNQTKWLRPLNINTYSLIYNMCPLDAFSYNLNVSLSSNLLPVSPSHVALQLPLAHRRARSYLQALQTLDTLHFPWKGQSFILIHTDINYM